MKFKRWIKRRLQNPCSYSGCGIMITAVENMVRNIGQSGSVAAGLAAFASGLLAVLIGGEKNKTD